MNTRAIAMGIVLMVAAACVVPALSDDSDAADTTRTSVFYIYEAKITYNGVHYTAVIYFNEGSENHNKFLQYLENPTGSSYAGETDSPSRGSECIAYYLSTSESDTYYINGEYVTGKLVQEPYGNSILSVKSGDDLKVTVNSATNDEGESVSCYLYKYGSLYSKVLTLTTGTEVSMNATVTSTYVIWVDSPYTTVFLDVSFTASGQSVPNGSATAFAAVCFVIAALAIGLIAFASLKPKWSK